MKNKRKQKPFLFLAVLMFVVAASLGTADAMQYTVGRDASIDCDVTIKYGGSIRVSDQDKDKLLNPTDPNPLTNGINMDDGNRNFEQWDMINNKLTLLADIDIKYKDFGLFIRPKAFYDHSYMTDNANDSPATNNATVGPTPIIDDNNEWPEELEDTYGRNAEILDLFAYGTFDVGGRFLEIRVGQQTISWGESLLISGGISSAQSHVDVNASVAVGTELKEIFLPSESVFVQMDVTENMAISAYYQWEWEDSRLFEGGGFFVSNTINDAFYDLDAPIIVPAPLFIIPRVKDDEASDSGQFGVSLTYVCEKLNATEFGLYYINYHDKFPTLNQQIVIHPVFGPIPTGYFLSYTEDIKLYGASFSSQIGDANLSGEFSYRQDYMFGAGDEGNYWQGQISWMYAVAFNPFADRNLFWGEIACNQTIGRSVADDVYAWRFVIRNYYDWYQVCKDLDVTLRLIYSDTPSGTAPAIPMGFTEGSASGSIGFDFLYKNIYRAGITYENRFNSKRNLNSDRDTLSLSLSYTF